MNTITVYIESNFVLELAFLQEQSQNCQQILAQCEAGKACLVLPAFSIAEPYEVFVRNGKDRESLRQKLKLELQQLSRNTTFPNNRVDALKEVIDILAQTTNEEEQRLHQNLDRMLKVCETIPVVPEILSLAATYRDEPLDLSIQDSIVYASVVHHLNTHNASKKCFLNRNSKDFNQPDIQATLKSHNCKLLFNFEKGDKYIRSQIDGS